MYILGVLIYIGRMLLLITTNDNVVFFFSFIYDKCILITNNINPQSHCFRQKKEKYFE